MFTELDPAIPVHVEGKGEGRAIGLIDNGRSNGQIWITEIEETGELWCVRDGELRLSSS